MLIEKPDAQSQLLMNILCSSKSDEYFDEEEESLSHTLHNVPVVSKKHLFPQEISLSMPTARAADSSGNLFFFPQTN